MKKTTISKNSKNANLYGYYEFLPDAYGTFGAEEKWPLIISFHGTNEAGNGTTDLNKLLLQGLPKKINGGFELNAVVIAPQSSGWFTSEGIGGFNENGVRQESYKDKNIIENAKLNYKIDPNRIYVTGYSSGGQAVWIAACNYPHLIAAAAPAAAAPYKYERAPAMRNIPTWAFHNNGDPSYLSSYTVNMVNEIKKTGGTPKLSIFTSNSHDSWSNTYDDKSLFDWMLVQVKGDTTPNAKPKGVITSPAANSQIIKGELFTVMATASDTDGTISKVVLYVDGKKIQEDNLAPFAFTTKIDTVGIHQVKIAVYDDNYEYSIYEIPVEIIEKPNVLPKIVVTTPVEGDEVIEGNPFNVGVTATDSDGVITKVQLFIDEYLHAESTEAPFNFSAVTSMVGERTIKIIAFDDKSDSSTETVKIKVLSKPSPIPTDIIDGLDNILLSLKEIASAQTIIKVDNPVTGTI